MKTLNIAIDIDGCLADFNSAYAQLLIKVAGVDNLPKGWKEDKAQRWAPKWDWEELYGYDFAIQDKVWREFIRPNKSFWKTLDPLHHEEATAVIRHLNYLSRMENHNVYFITHRNTFRAKHQTEEWLERYGTHRPTVVISGDKIPALRALDIDIFIDDREDTIRAAVEAQQLKPNPYLKDSLRIYTKAAAWNVPVEGSERVMSVKEMLIMEGLWDGGRRKT